MSGRHCCLPCAMHLFLVLIYSSITKGQSSFQQQALTVVKSVRQQRESLDRDAAEKQMVMRRDEHVRLPQKDAPFTHPEAKRARREQLVSILGGHIKVTDITPQTGMDVSNV
ncbi:hypothetical protein NDU88_004712 [Pleurodeles waltl]|uniref:Uncharacterized protein n=1 Tax=Pleurodeles waltl TaxID=8319 RepID=A0AAV7WB59_PLEWA|nr:hypothetical protein NDU88_004712 [Pleurodeles waltl]